MKAKLSLIAALLVTMPAHADFMVGLDGRTADLFAQPQMAVEVNTSTFDKNIKSVGARISYKLSDTLMAYGDFSQVTTEEDGDDLPFAFKGQALGGGVIFDVPNVLSSMNTSLKLSYHMADLPNETKLTTDNGQPASAEISFKAMSAKIMLSPLDPIGESGLMWFASIGYASVDTTISIDLPGQSASLDGEPLKGLAGGVGIIYPLSFGEVYAGFESIDGEGQTGGGIRYNF